MNITQTIPLNASERIMFERAEFGGTRFYDPALEHDATYADLITAAGYRTIAIYRLDKVTGQLTPITDEIALHYLPNGSMEFPRWVMSSVRLGDIMAQARAYAAPAPQMECAA